MIRFLRLLTIPLLILLSSVSLAEELTEENVRSGIIGQWRLVSFERKGKIVDDYTGENVIWRFNADGTLSLTDRQLGAVQDTYRVVKSKYGWIGKGGIILLIMELKKRGFSHPKFMVRKMTSEGDLLLGDWNDTLLYRLKRMK